MKKLLLLIFLYAGLCGQSIAQNSPGKEAPSQEQAKLDTAPALTIYNQNFFVAREYVPLDLKPGINRVNYAGVAAHLEPDSVILRDPNGRALQILEQNYRNDPISQELLLSFYEGKTLDFLVQHGDHQEIIKGRVVRSGYVPSQPYNQGYAQPSYTPAHHRSGWHPAFRIARPAAISCAERGFHPQADA